jgi:hypothetical protein
MEGKSLDHSLLALEFIAKNFVLPSKQDEFLASRNLPTSPEQMRFFYLSRQDKLLDLFNCILAKDENNLYGNFGMFQMECYKGRQESALEYAYRGINFNINHADVYELRTSVAEFHESHGRHNEANEMYIDNINSTLVYMKSCIDSFVLEAGNKLAFTARDFDIKVIEDSHKTPMGTYIASNMLSSEALESQDSSKRADFAKALVFQNARNYQMANTILDDLNNDFSDFDSYLSKGLESLQKKVQLKFKKNIFKNLEEKLGEETTYKSTLHRVNLTSGKYLN